MKLGPDAATAVVRGLGAYMRSAAPTDLPRSLRPLRNLRDNTLQSRHLSKVLEAFDDEQERALVRQWLDDGGPKKLTKTEVSTLRQFLDRPEGWEGRLAGAKPKPKAEAPDRSKELLERERSRTAKAREERDLARAEARDVTRESTELKRKVESARAEADRHKVELSEAKKKLARAAEDAERAARKAKRDLERMRVERDELKQRHRAEVKGLKAEISEARAARPTPKARKAGAAPKARSKAPARRSKLAVPLGRTEDDPKTLAEWLTTTDVLLLIDGYNVTKNESGFGDLPLEAQRERLKDLATGIARRFGVETRIVFDGANVPPVPGSRKRSPVKVEYSRADEIADDHLVALVESLPPRPVVVVTSDKELQRRVAKLGATVATSPQLLGLAR